MKALILFIAITVSASAWGANRCGWVTSYEETHIDLYDNSGVWVIAAPDGTGLYFNAENSQLVRPDARDHAYIQTEDGWITCGCINTRYENHRDPVFIKSISSIKTYENIALEKCISDPALPSLQTQIEKMWGMAN